MSDLVREIILEPMCALFPPPQHLRDRRETLALALASYERALARFDRATLQQGWDQVVAEQTFWCWPNPGEIVAACRQCLPRSPSDEEKRKAQALELADAYTSRFMKTAHVARLARREGWSGRLQDYVQDAAWVQAQLICGVRNLGWNTHLAENLGAFRSSAEAFAAYRATLAGQVERGQLRVTVPRRQIADWKEQHAELAPVPEEAAAGRNAG